MCKCSYCNSTENVKSTAYGLYAMYNNICIDCYNKLENKNKIILKKEAI